MGIFKGLFSGFTRKPDDNILHTPHGDFNLAKDSDRKRVQKMVIELQRTTDALTRKDIQDWRNAWQLAINVDYPYRQPLYDIYRDTLIDLHLSGCIEQRKGFVMSRSFKIVDAKGNEQKEALHYFQQAWFKQLLKHALDSIYWGHSLIELGDITVDGDGCICYDGVKLIPRKHVIPEYSRVISDLGQSWTSGMNYKEPPFTDWLIEAGEPENLGLLLKAATQTIPKKNMLSFWDTFGEIFGMPMRIAKTTTRDPKEFSKLENMMRNVPDEVLLYNTSKNMFSKWFFARGLFTLGAKFKDVQLSHFDDVQSMRAYISQQIHDFHALMGRGVIAHFDSDSYGRHIWFSRMGEGSLGGKARGLAFLNSLVYKHKLADKYENVKISIPRTVVIATDYFDQFILDNDLQYVIDSEISDEEVLSEFVSSRLPVSSLR